MTGPKKQIESWLRAAGVTWDSAVIDISESASSYSGVSLAVFAKRHIKEGETLCMIPKSALLSIRNTGAADIIQEERLGGGLGLVFAVMYEMCRGEASPWHGYFLSMPSREYLPIFWTDEELETLKGTELEDRVAKDRCCALLDL
mmetsp:Transcript_31520/g.89487  ORF Transcript_31520/g.89487 Transcript_31520/m.89487 type:complete len:145 (+) Transcript_31520:40-474(+)